MATYKYSATPTGTIFGTTSGFPTFTTNDIFSIDDESISASSITSINQAGTTTTITFAGKTITFKGLTKDTIAKTNFIFADGSQLIIGDGTNTGGANDTGNNTLYSTEFNDYLDGMTGTDTVSYINATSAVTVSLDAAVVGTLTAPLSQDTLGAGTDKLVNIENLTGSNYNDTLTGSAGNNVLDGGLGVDTLIGGAGNDTYYVTAGDSITDSAGTDTVISSIDYVLATGLENLTLSGLTAVTAIGNGVANTIIGNNAGNVLDGKGGADTMRGLAGDDTYFVDTSDTVDETIAGSSGTDLVIASATFTLTNNVENLRLMATAGTAITGTGNVLNNIIYAGNSNDTMDGGTGTDTLSYQYATGKVNVTLGDSETNTATPTAASGATGGSGTDSNVDFENLTGGSYSDTLKGNSAANIISGGAGLGLGNDYLIGVGANDTLVGGLGNDTYEVDATTGYTITESSSAGTADTVIYTGTSGTFDISTAALANIENLTMGGSSNIGGKGNISANILTGNTGGNSLDAGAGDDQLYDGGNTTAGGSRVVDSLTGGLGNDTYYVNSSDTTITEASGAGIDLVSSSVDYVLNDTSSIGVENLTLTGAANINATGNTLANILTGNSGNNTLSGGDGTDTLIGGAGDDTYIIGTRTVGAVTTTDAADIIVEATTNTGTDTVQSAITYALNDLNGAGVENLTLTGAANINGTGNARANTITGNSGNNTLIGGEGTDTLAGGDGNDILTGGLSITTGEVTLVADSLSGGNGNDTYYITDLSADTITEASGAGTDLVISSIDYTLGANLENLTLTGTVAKTATGNGDANTITANSLGNTLNGLAGTDTLVGGAGADTLDGGTNTDGMSGGAGNDTYIVDNTGDTVTELTNSGTDLVKSSVTYTLAANVENLTLTGATTGTTADTDTINATGNALANILTGNAGSNTLIGGEGADTLSGGSGTDKLTGGLSINSATTATAEVTAVADSLSGGDGDDTYYITDKLDTVTETATGGSADQVFSSVDYTLTANVENLTLTGTATKGTGNASDNSITGNDAGNTLSGLAGNDTLTGGNGTDTLDGGAGDDSMSGGAGNDTYVVDSTTDTITESASGGTDQVNSSATFTLANEVDNLTLTGTAAIDGTGNSSANILTGNSGVNVLTGNDGADTLNGGTGADTLIGGNGSDTYIVDNVSDLVDETTGTTSSDAVAATVATASGVDLVNSSVTYTITDVLIENLTLTGSSAINGTGNSSANILTGNSGSNTLNAAEGDDIINGGAGKDTLTGGDGADTFVFSTSTDSGLATFDIITDFSQGGSDKIDLSGIDTGTLSFNGTAVASGATVVSAAHTVDYFVTGTNTFIIADTNGDTTIDFKVELLSFTGTLTASDFSL